jgi:hypothetical protein
MSSLAWILLVVGVVALVLIWWIKPPSKPPLIEE